MAGPAAGSLGRLRGCVTALVTPFRDEEVDTATLARLCERQVAAGTAGLLVCGSTGEAAALADAEQRRVIETAVDAVRGRVPVIAGCGAAATRPAVARALEALRSGADGVLCAPPPYSKPTPEGIRAHTEAVATVGLPVILYDVPNRTGVAVADETVARLHRCGAIIGIKDASGDLSRPARLRSMAGPTLRQFGGDDATTAAFLAMGGHGCISVTANLVPRLCGAMHAAWEEGRLDDLARFRDLLDPLSRALFRETNPILVKAAMVFAGLCEGGLRLPLLPAAPEALAALLPAVEAALLAELACPAAGNGDAAVRRIGSLPLEERWVAFA